MHEGPWKWSEQVRFLLLLLLVPVVAPWLSFLLFVPTERSDWRGGGEMQQLLHCFSPSWCGNWTQNLARHKQILHCSCRTLPLVVGAFFQHFFLGRRPEDLSLRRKSWRDNAPAPKLEKGLGLKLCLCAWCYPEPRNSRFLLAPNGLFFSPEFREDTPLPASESAGWGKCPRYNRNV